MAEDRKRSWRQDPRTGVLESKPKMGSNIDAILPSSAGCLENRRLLLCLNEISENDAGKLRESGRVGFTKAARKSGSSQRIRISSAILPNSSKRFFPTSR